MEFLIWVLNLLLIYELTLIFVGVLNRNKNNEPTVNGVVDSKFCILIACHNEEEVIEDNLKSILDSDYPTELYEVFVIADNCSDNTSQKCWKFKEQYNNMKLEVIEVKGGSKPLALNLGIDKIKKQGKWNADFIIVLDADNKISKGMLSDYNRWHIDFPILQCRIMSDNDDSFVAQGYTSSFNVVGYSRQLTRNRVGLSASLSGTGFSVSREVFDEIDFQNCDTLTEDLEFSIMAILGGYKIKYVAEQYVLNQNLDRLKPSIVQRVRWCRGHMQVSKKLSVKILKSWFNKPSLQLFDSFMFINTPSRALLLTMIFIYLLFWDVTISRAVAWCSILLLCINIFIVLHCNKMKLRYLFANIFYGVFMYVAIIYGGLTYKKTKWVKTEHKKIIHK